MEFTELMNRVCRDLPSGWELQIHLERNAGAVVLYDETGEEYEFDTNYECFEQQVIDALEDAISTEPKPPASPGTEGA